MTSRGNKRVRWLWCSLLLVAALAMPAAVWAQLAYTIQAVNMRAGPDREYPQVAWLPSGVAVDVIGCVEGYRWCDVAAGPNRGWVYAQFLSYPYQNQPVPIISGGAILGLPLITFSIGPYWDSYYRGRPWYGNRSYWYSRPTPYYRPPPHYQPPPPRPPVYIPPSSRPPGYVPPPHRPPGYVPPQRPPGYVPPSGGRPPGGRPPSGGGPPNTGQPPGGRPPPNAGQPPGNPPPSGGRPQSGGRPATHQEQPSATSTPQK
jgi:uncharacterized protein YraI